MSIQLVAKGHHMRKIVRNGEEEVRRTGELAATKQRAAQKIYILRLSDSSGIPGRRRKDNPIIHN